MEIIEFGNSDYFILEACEYVESFLKFSPKSTIVLNIDNDHLDYFKNFDNIVLAFQKYVSLIPHDGLLIVNGDDENCLALREHSQGKFITFGIDNLKSHYNARNISFDQEGNGKYDLYVKGTYACEIKLSVPRTS